MTPDAYQADWLKAQISHYMRDHRMTLHTAIFAAFYDWSRNRSGAYAECFDLVPGEWCEVST
jgi:hypothetical protein